MEQSPYEDADRFAAKSGKSRNSSKFMEPKGPLPHLQEPATCPYLQNIGYAST